MGRGFQALAPQVDVSAHNIPRRVSAAQSLQMDFSDYGRTPMLTLSEIIWKSVRVADSEVPLPVSRFHVRY